MPVSIHITTPLTEEVVTRLKIGDTVLITGKIYAARDAAHKRLMETLERGEPLPVDLKNQIIYYVGPSPAKPGQVIGSAGPTTAGRMDAYTPALLEQGLRGIIGKGSRSAEVIESIIKHKAIYFAAVGGVGALLATHITSYEVLAYPDLGPEAVAVLEVVDFPVVVVVDSEGGDYYLEGQKAYQK